MAEPLNDPREIRKLLDRVAQGRDRVDGTPARIFNLASNITHRVFMVAQHEGLSGEDTMTMLAYHALLAYESAADRAVESIMMTPVSHAFVIKKDS